MFNFEHISQFLGILFGSLAKLVEAGLFFSKKLVNLADQGHQFIWVLFVCGQFGKFHPSFTIFQLRIPPDVSPRSHCTV
jgi:hypothetical protein